MSVHHLLDSSIADDELDAGLTSPPADGPILWMLLDVFFPLAVWTFSLAISEGYLGGLLNPRELRVVSLHLPGEDGPDSVS